MFVWGCHAHKVPSPLTFSVTPSELSGKAFFLATMPSEIVCSNAIQLGVAGYDKKDGAQKQENIQADLQVRYVLNTGVPHVWDRMDREKF